MGESGLPLKKIHLPGIILRYRTRRARLLRAVHLGRQGVQGGGEAGQFRPGALSVCFQSLAALLFESGQFFCPGGKIPGGLVAGLADLLFQTLQRAVEIAGEAALPAAIRTRA